MVPVTAREIQTGLAWMSRLMAVYRVSPRALPTSITRYSRLSAYRQRLS